MKRLCVFAVWIVACCAGGTVGADDVVIYPRRPHLGASQVFVRPQFEPADPRAARYWRDEQLRAMYPKYFGGLHARHIENLGVPPGDIGLRGNGLYWTPW